jgi:adenosylcobinamide kinase/adenosylcobinamide-phosphate guanylyltransferase
MKTRKKCVTLVLGGARSGKSRYAEQAASRFERVTFIATARPADSEMRNKIARHRGERPAAWKTVEAPLNLHETIRSESQKADVLLVDCLTLYVANVMSAKKSRKSDQATHVEEVCDAICASKSSVIVVSNEVGSGIVPAYRSGRVYRDFLGQMNQRLAQVADKVVLMVAGLPIIVKDSTVA